MPTPPEFAVALAAPCALKPTEIASPVRPAIALTPAPAPEESGVAVANALPLNESATAAAHRQLSPTAVQPSVALTNEPTADCIAASELRVWLRVGVAGGKPEPVVPPVVTDEPGLGGEPD